MPKCSYCGKDYEIHKGVTLVRSSGNINHLCSAKCRKNMLMKRRKVRWVSKGKKSKISSSSASTRSVEQKKVENKKG